MEDLGVGCRIILKCIIKKQDGGGGVSRILLARDSGRVLVDSTQEYFTVKTDWFIQ